MSMRMVPLTNTFQKMNRIVFDVSRKLGKDINFEMIGDTTEVLSLIHIWMEAVDAFMLALEEGEPYDLVCLDIMMPVMDGYQALMRCV